MIKRLHVKKNDVVVVLSGEDGGKRGKVLQVLPKKERVIIEGVNFIKKHVKKSPNNPQGGIETREGTIHASKVMLAEKYDQRKARRTKAA
ncbi:MAG: 50S ribosomal protein L24 [Verrucomicrobiae bacterium]|nr:50S ribosomal protein L24 [Verrucomicrobiae bacterium]